MSFWTTHKDRAAIARAQDEAFHEQAYQEIQSGRRRDGLWAKAVIASGGNEASAKLAYLKLLVSAIRDDHYLTARFNEELANEEAARVAAYEKKARVPPPDHLNGYDEHGRTPLMNAVLARDIETVRDLLSQGADASKKDNNFGTSTALDLASLAVRRALSVEDRALCQSIVDTLRQGRQ